MLLSGLSRGHFMEKVLSQNAHHEIKRFIELYQNAKRFIELYQNYVSKCTS